MDDKLFWEFEKNQLHNFWQTRRSPPVKALTTPVSSRGDVAKEEIRPCI
jgi:hypothetical protein